MQSSTTASGSNHQWEFLCQALHVIQRLTLGMHIMGAQIAKASLLEATEHHDNLIVYHLPVDGRPAKCTGNVDLQNAGAFCRSTGSSQSECTMRLPWCSGPVCTCVRNEAHMKNLLPSLDEFLVAMLLVCRGDTSLHSSSTTATVRLAVPLLSAKVHRRCRGVALDSAALP